MKNNLAILTSIVAAGFLVACSAITSQETESQSRIFPTPTYHALFQVNAPIGTSVSDASISNVPTVASVFRLQPSTTPSPFPTSTAIPRSTATQTPQPHLFAVSVYGDSLNPNWVIQENTGMNFDLNSVDYLLHGKSAISFVPHVKSKTDYGSLLFTVSDQSKVAYPAEQVTALSFWLYSGDEPLLLDQVAVTVVGSNSQPFWKANDDSVAASGQDPVFSETRLYFLGFNRDIPAKTWVEVEVDLDKLIYDPDYKYVTAFYLKMEKGFSRTLWVDDINLLMLGKPPEIIIPTSTATGASN